MPRVTSPFAAVRSEGALLPPELLARIAELDRDLPGLTPSDYHLVGGGGIGPAIAQSWNRLLGIWKLFSASLAALPPDDHATGLTREKWLAPLFDELGFGRLVVTPARVVDGVSYPISHGWAETPIHLIGANLDLDRRTPGAIGAARMSPHTLVQTYLNRVPTLWGIVSNGRELRLLRDNLSLTRQAYLAFDLETMFSGEIYADFAILWLICHQSRFEAPADRPAECFLERWSQGAEHQGTRALEALRQGVETAIETLGAGFLAHRANGSLRAALTSGDLSTQDYYRELLRLVYRLIFLFVAEDRDLLHPEDTPLEARLRYREHYSMTRLRALSERLRGGPHADLWQGVTVICGGLADPEGLPALGLPFLGSSLFAEDSCPHLDGAELANRDLLSAIRALSSTLQGRVRRPIDYRNMGSEELGSIYESLLELHPEVHHETATFDLETAPGNERKTTGSYYTPSSLIAALLDTALDPVLEEAASKPEPEAAILALKVLDPAVGSGHFLTAAAHRIARRLAQVRSGDDEPSPGAIRTALRDVIARCVYGIDMNPMAVELCKVSLWMEAMEPGKALSFLDHHIVCGNSLLGTTPALINKGIPDGAYEALAGDDKAIARSLKKRNREERDRGQTTLFGEAAAPDLVAEAAAKIAELEAAPGETAEELAAKRALYEQATHAAEAAKLVADAWCAAFFVEKVEGAPEITTGVLRLLEAHPEGGSTPMKERIRELAETNRFLHLHLAFPQVFHIPGEGEEPEDPEQGWSGGFDVVVGNPPFMNQLELGTVTDAAKSHLMEARLAGVIQAYTDISARFLAMDIDLVREGGRVALVQPQSVLAVRDAGGVRGKVMREASPVYLWVAGAKVFAASVLVCFVTFERLWRPTAVIGRATGPTFSVLPSITRSRSELEALETWSPLIPEAFGTRRTALKTAGQLQDIAEITADFRDQFYGLIPFVYEGQEAKEAGDPQLITTGLIDPALCNWGAVTTRFGKKTWMYPRVHLRRLTSESDLGPWARARLVPKVLVATQTRIIEAVVDLGGEWLPSIPTVTVAADPDDLFRIGALLSSPPIAAWALESFGGAALGTDAIKLSAKQLRSAPLPCDVGAWERAGKEFRLASNARLVGQRSRHLQRSAAHMCDAYAAEADLLDWWRQRLPRDLVAEREKEVVEHGT